MAVQLLFALLVVVVVVAGLVAIAALIINAVVKVNLAKYNSIQQGSQPAVKQDGVWPPAPSVTQSSEPTPPQAATLPIRSNAEHKREGGEQVQDEAALGGIQSPRLSFNSSPAFQCRVFTTGHRCRELP